MHRSEAQAAAARRLLVCTNSLEKLSGADYDRQCHARARAGEGHSRQRRRRPGRVARARKRVQQAGVDLC